MKTSILICATCFIVTGCSAQLRFPSLSSALSSLTGFGGANSNAQASGQGQASSQPSSPYSGLVQSYGRNLMMAMSSIYPTLFKPPQSQQQAQQSQPAPQSAYEQAFGAASQYGAGNLFPSQSAPSFSFGGSTFSISPSLPFGLSGGGGSSSLGSAAAAALGGQQAGPQASSGSHSPFSASFGSSINSPSSFGPLSSASFLQQGPSMGSFAPASSYGAAFEAANSGVPSFGAPSSNGGAAPSGLGGPSQMHSSNAPLMTQSSNSNPINSASAYSPMQAYGSQHDVVSGPMVGLTGSQSGQLPQGVSNHPSHSAPMQFGPGPGQQHQPSVGGVNQFGSAGPAQQYRPDMMSIAASAPVPSSNSYSNYGNMQAASSVQAQQQQGPGSQSSYQQPSYR